MELVMEDLARPLMEQSELAIEAIWPLVQQSEFVIEVWARPLLEYHRDPHCPLFTGQPFSQKLCRRISAEAETLACLP